MNEMRKAILAEARSWIGTPFHSGGRLKGVGVDCGQILLLIYEAVGLIPCHDPGYYPADYHLHKSEEWYLALMDRFAKRVPGPPRPGDVALWKFGRVFSHGGVVVEWPRVIHACFPARQVQEDSADRVGFFYHRGSPRPVLFFDAVGN
jgi:cell wall-associated NlpC family hydrolase